MNPISRRTFVKLGVGLVAFVPAARALAAIPDTPSVGAGTRTGRRRAEKYLGGWVIGVAPGQLKVRAYDGQYVAQISKDSEIWKGDWDKNATIEAGDRIEARGTRRDGWYFDVERMWVNIVNLIGPVSNIRETTEHLQLTQQDRFRGPLSVAVDRRTLIVSSGQEQLYAPGQLRLIPGQRPQIIGLLLKDGSVRATRVFA